MRIELPERMAQLLQNLPHKLSHLAQRMVRRNAPLRLDVREHSPLIEKPSPHRKSSRRISRKSESLPLHSGEVFQQTARGSSKAANGLKNFVQQILRPDRGVFLRRPDGAEGADLSENQRLT